MQVVDAAHGAAVEGDDDVAFAQFCARRRTIGLDRDNQHAGFLLQLLRADKQAWNLDGLTADAEIGAADAAVFDQLTGDKFRGVDRDRKTGPCAGRMTAVLTPITSPREFSSGPPEFPGLSAASV